MMNLSGWYWREPLLLILTLLPVLFIVINRWWHQKKMLQIADHKLLAWVQTTQQQKRKILPMLFLLAGWLMLCVALAGPRTVKQLPPGHQPDSSMLMVVIDFSASMHARDVRQDRRTVAQQFLIRWLSEKPASLSVGIVLFSGHAFTLIPPTTDQNLLLHFANSLHDIHLPTAGNDLAAAIELAGKSLLSSNSLSNLNHRRLWVLTDGDMEIVEQEKVSRLLDINRVQNSIQIQFVGIGDAKPVTIPNRVNGLIEFQGRPVLSRLEPAWMQQLAENSNINYQHYRWVEQQSLNDLLGFPPLRLNDKVQQQVLWQEWFSFPLLCGMLCLMLSLLLHSRQPAQSRSVVHSPASVYLLLLLVVAELFQSDVLADDNNLLVQAQQALVQKNYPLSRQLFSQIDSLTGFFGEGTACYRMQDFECAKQAFARAAWLASENSQRATAVFNLANSNYFAGDYDQSVVLYRDAELLGLDPALSSINRVYAEAMQSTIQKHLTHIRQNFEKARWKAAVAGKQVPSLSEYLSIDENLLTDEFNQKSRPGTYKPASGSLKNELKRQLGLNSSTQNRVAGRWVETDKVLPQTTAKMINRLFEMELGIPAELDQPQLVEGKRAW